MVSKCSFDSLSLQECFEQFLIGVSGLASQLLLPLPPQSLQEENKVKMKTLSRNRLPATQTHARGHTDLQGSASSAAVHPHQTQRLAWCGRRVAYRCGGREWAGGRSGRCCLHGPSPLSPPGSAIYWCLRGALVKVSAMTEVSKTYTLLRQKKQIMVDRSKINTAFLTEDTNSKDLSLQCLGVDGFPCALQ